LGGSFAFQDKDLARLDVRIFQKTSGEVSESIWTIASGILLWTTAIAVSRWELAPRKLPANRGRRPGQVVWLGYSIHLPRSEYAPGIAQFPPLPAATFKLTHCPQTQLRDRRCPSRPQPPAVAERVVRRRTTSRDFRTHRRPKLDVVHCDNCSTFYFGVCHE
jgi:hypothetical protein